MAADPNRFVAGPRGVVAANPGPAAVAGGGNVPPPMAGHPIDDVGRRRGNDLDPCRRRRAGRDCDGANDYSTGNQRSIDADITAARNEGPTPSNQNPAQISVLPTVTVPFPSAY